MVGFAASEARALSPVVEKLHSKQSLPAEFGNAVAVSDRWIVVGESKHQDLAANAGAIHVFDARTGGYLRRIRASDGAAGDFFGTSVSLCGNLVLVGAPGDEGNRGGAYLIDVRNGREVRKLAAFGAVANEYFGDSVALAGDLAVIGVPGRNGGTGEVFVFDTRTGTLRQILAATGGAAGDEFGRSVATDGRRVLTGAWGRAFGTGAAYYHDGFTGDQLWALTATGGAPGHLFGISVSLCGSRALVGATGTNGFQGTTYVFDLHSGLQTAALTAPDGVGGDNFGVRVAAEGNLALIGAHLHDSGSGAAYLFDLSTQSFLGKLVAPDGKGGDHLGSATALCGDLAVLGAPGDDEGFFADTGSAYLFRGMTGPLPMTSLASVGDFAPGTFETRFGRFEQPVVNRFRDVAYRARLSGPGSRGGRDRGIWTDSILGIGSPRFVDLSTKTRPAGLAGPAIRQVRGLSRETVTAYDVFFAGPGFNARNSQAILTDDGTGPVILAQAGDPVVLGGPLISRFHEVLQQRLSTVPAIFHGFTLSCALDRASLIGVTARDDSVLAMLAPNGATALGTVREGDAIVAGTFLQLFPEAAKNHSSYTAFGGYFLDAVANSKPLQKTWTRDVDANFTSPIAFQGNQAPGCAPGQLFRSFAGLGIQQVSGLVKARLQGPGVNGGNNEGIWKENVGTPDLLVREGDEPVQGAIGVGISRIVRFWPLDSGLIAEVRLRGPGVNASNDAALILRQSNGTYLSLLREGDPVVGCDCPRIRAIQRVAVNPVTGAYAVVASLTGSPRRNQALLTGVASVGNDIALRALRLPHLALRKGTPFNTPFSGATTLRSLLLSPQLDRHGVGAKGLGQVVADGGEVVMDLQFDDRSRELVLGAP
ncbi:MAG: FG-GAP repeat protein [Verrucomicrobiae bacterium]|nr:FG-GAP repeat protein [Verrucomicrobiae bacterium]